MGPEESTPGEPGPLTARRLMERVYAEIRRLAHREMANEAQPATLQTTALVHETWLRLEREGRDAWESRAQFFVAASTAMRRILVERARRRARLRRGGDRRRSPLDEQQASGDEPQHEPQALVTLDAALSDLRRFRWPLARLVELRVFAGMTEAETARVLGVSARSVRRDWRAARLWLWQRMQGSNGGAT